ncbi:hypothetical protein M431DRAFT_253797 [Trichoderma harzianum CBS 226.95]|uniref:Uncharacterized protein n=1 Tax=Trichoderma harzianum CBS 226.95 TaxID=983964 RepID=A0A2T4A076_TRIHA|nr:hypothetical protein M431DRAFT_253797 [Trichoderma harzianum CBS 226.95]PTB50467.1 hypothetical protein M431DRAFT_253797 [Trichoderma harzianum CBS 226.95]
MVSSCACPSPWRALASAQEAHRGGNSGSTMTYFHRHRHNHVSAMRPSHSGRTPSSHTCG